MKKSVLTSVVIYCCCAVFSSCGGTCKFDYDDSLAGSISYSYMAKIEGTFGGKPLFIETLNGYPRCYVDKASDTKIGFWCDFYGGVEEGKWKRFGVKIRELPISGKPYDVTFDHVSQASVEYDDDFKPNSGDGEYVEYHSVTTSIKGWMKEETGLWGTRCSPASPSYDCDITIGCTIEGKELIFKATKLM